MIERGIFVENLKFKIKLKFLSNMKMDKYVFIYFLIHRIHDIIDIID